jgi:aspartyl-tRNA(Asn)/glutamyl-tRNA(Gln) amidotransferase subunit B
MGAIRQGREMRSELIVGLEVHVQLSTKTKAFCRCENIFGGIPNSRVCPVCLGLPGALPSVNGIMIDYAILAGLALHCTVAQRTRFDRKNYLYPDLPKGYQISQFDAPICTGGYLDVVTTDRGKRTINIRRLHMEEDAGKLIHLEGGSGMSYVDFNRCGAPLLEIVSEPDIRSAEEAAAYAQGIREIVRYLGISDGNMEEGSLRCDANVNLRLEVGGADRFTPIVEVKNMNSFKALKSALSYEAERQLEEAREGGGARPAGHAGKSTRGFDESTGTTVLLRAKEEASDYRYFPEPDLRPIDIPESLVKSLSRRVGEMPAERRERFQSLYLLTAGDAEALCASKALSDYFEETVSGYREYRRAAGWILTEVCAALNERGIGISDFTVPPGHIRELLRLVDSRVLSGRLAKEVFAEMAATGRSPGQIVSQRALSQIKDPGELDRIAERVVAENPGPAADFRGGKKQALKFLMGQVMKETGGRADPKAVSDILTKKLGGGGTT